MSEQVQDLRTEARAALKRSTEAQREAYVQGIQVQQLQRSITQMALERGLLR